MEKLICILSHSYIAYFAFTLRVNIIIAPREDDKNNGRKNNVLKCQIWLDKI